jgi:hypothetical protein
LHLAKSARETDYDEPDHEDLDDYKTSLRGNPVSESLDAKTSAYSRCQYSIVKSKGKLGYEMSTDLDTGLAESARETDDDAPDHEDFDLIEIFYLDK